MPNSKRRDVLKGVAGIGAGSMTMLAGCTDQGNDGDTDGGGENGGSNSLKVGHLAPLSGPFGQIGNLMKDGTDLAVKELNEADNGLNVEAVHKDTQVSPDTAVSAARELVTQENVDVLAGCSSSAVGSGISEFASSQDVVYLATVPQSPSLTGSDCNKMTFRSGGNLNMLMQALAMTTDELTDGSTLAGIIPDSGATRELWDVFSSTLVDTADVEIVNTTYPAFGAGDYQNEIQQTMNADPDIVFASMWGGDLISFIQQARGFDFFEEIPEFVASAGSTADVSVSLGEDMVEMIGLDRYFFQFPDTERNQQFVEAYRDEYDSYPLSVSQEAYAGVYGLSAAVEASGETSSDGIVSGLEGLEWEAPEGPKKMRAADHQVIEDKIWCGRIGPVEGLPFYGYSDMRPVDGAEVAGEPNCSF